MSLTKLLDQLEKEFREEGGMMYHQWYDLREAIVSANVSGANVTVTVEPNVSPKITIEFHGDKR